MAEIGLTIEEQYNNIINAIGAEALLSDWGVSNVEEFADFINDLKDQSKAGDLRELIYLVAFSQKDVEEKFKLLSEELDKKSQESNYGHDLWWIDRLFEFQYGYELKRIVEDGIAYLRYETIDEDAQIITRVAIAKADDGIGSVIKIALGEEALTAPSEDQKNAITAYIDRLMGPGSTLFLVAKNSDKVRYYIDVYYNPEGDINVIKANTEAAINLYHTNLTTRISFDGRIDLRKMSDKIQDVPFVVNFEVKSAQIKPEGAPEWITFGRERKTLAGYAEIHPDFPLSTTINYIPYE